MTFTESIKTCLFKKYFSWNGRASRSEFWFFYLFAWILDIVLQSFSTISGIIGLLLIIPAICVTSRRLHDTGHSGLWQFVPFALITFGVLLWFGDPYEESSLGMFATFAGFLVGLVMLYFCIKKGTPAGAPNPYGEAEGAQEQNAGGTRIPTPNGGRPEGGSRLPAPNGGWPAERTREPNDGFPGGGSREPAQHGGRPEGGNRTSNGGWPAGGTREHDGGWPAGGTREHDAGWPAGGNPGPAGTSSGTSSSQDDLFAKYKTIPGQEDSGKNPAATRDPASDKTSLPSSPRRPRAYCPNCGEKIGERDHYCSHCGRKLDEISD